MRENGIKHRYGAITAIYREVLLEKVTLRNTLPLFVALEEEENNNEDKGYTVSIAGMLVIFVCKDMTNPRGGTIARTGSSTRVIGRSDSILFQLHYSLCVRAASLKIMWPQKFQTRACHLLHYNGVFLRVVLSMKQLFW